MPENAALSRRGSKARADRRALGNTRDRILEISLKLFNELGTPSVSTNTIAAQLGISPGNLYYHFANKEEIVRELWTQFAELLRREIFDVVEEGMTPEGLAGLLAKTSTNEWRYRFFFRDLNELLARDPELAEAFRSEMEWGRDRVLSLFRALGEQNSLAASERELAFLSNNMLIVLLNWSRFVITMRGTAEVTAADIADGVLHAFVMCEPYLASSYAKRARAALEQHRSGVTEPS